MHTHFLKRNLRIIHIGEIGIMKDLLKICALKENFITAIVESLVGTNVSRSKEYCRTAH